MRPCVIFKTLKKQVITKSMVYRTIKRLSETGSIDDRRRSGRSRSACIPAMVKRLRSRLERNPPQSQRKLAQGLKTSKTSVQTMIRMELKFRPFKKRVVHGLTTKQRKKRLDRSKLLKSRHASENLDKIFFSDEKIFCVEESYNSQNVRVYAAAFEDIPEHLRTMQGFQGEASIMVWAGVSQKGKLPLVFIEPGSKVDGNYYREHILERVVEPKVKNCTEVPVGFSSKTQRQLTKPKSTRTGAP